MAKVPKTIAPVLDPPGILPSGHIAMLGKCGARKLAALKHALASIRIDLRFSATHRSLSFSASCLGKLYCL